MVIYVYKCKIDYEHIQLTKRIWVVIYNPELFLHIILNYAF